MRKRGTIWLMIVGILLMNMFAVTAFAASSTVDVADMDELLKAAKDKDITTINLLFEADFSEVAEVLRNNPGLTINPNGYGMYIGETLLLKDGASVKLKGKASDNMGVLGFQDGAKIELQKIDSFTLFYSGTDLCTQDHDDVAQCAAEKYECCENILLTGNGEFTFKAAKDYAGHFDVSITYLDGKVVETTDLSDITYDKLRGAVELNIQYVEAEEPETVSVSGKLVWDDDDNKFEIRPKSVTIDVYRNGKKIDVSKKVSEGKFTFYGLTKTDADGDDYTYTVRMRNDLKPEYTTKYNDTTRTITNKLNTLEATISYKNVATDEEIAESETFSLPYGWSLHLAPIEFEDGQYAIADEGDAEVILENVKKDVEYTFYYDEFVMLSGTHEYINEEGYTGARFSTLNTIVKSNGQLDSSLQIPTGKTKSSFETGYDYRKYDDNGEAYTYTLAAADQTPGYTQNYSVKNGAFTITSSLNDVEVTVLSGYSSDPSQTRADGSPVFDTKALTGKYGTTFTYQVPATAQYNGKTVQLSGARTSDGYDTDGQTNTIVIDSLDEDITITAMYIDLPN